MTYESYNDNLAINLMKEEVCFIAEDFEAEFETIGTISYDTMLGETYLLGEVRFVGPELLFQPSLWGIEGLGLTEAITAAIEGSDNTVKADLLSNIVLGGGNTLLKGLEERIIADLTKKGKSKVKVVALEGRENSAFVGV